MHVRHLADRVVRRLGCDRRHLRVVGLIPEDKTVIETLSVKKRGVKFANHSLFSLCSF
jgi:hypothetical protein